MSSRKGKASKSHFKTTTAETARPILEPSRGLTDEQLAKLGIKRKAATARPKRCTVTVEELSDMLGIGRNQAYQALKAGRIPAIRIGKRWIISDAVVDRLLGNLSTAA